MKHAALAVAAALILVQPVHAAPEPAPSPGEIVAAAPADAWREIETSDLLVMTLAPDREGRARRVVIQLAPAPFAAGWVANIRTLAGAGWWNGTSVNRVQDNYVVQWGDATESKALPTGLRTMTEADYVVPPEGPMRPALGLRLKGRVDPYGARFGFFGGFPVAGQGGALWLPHCYGMVGVGRNLSPDTGSGAELYVVIGHGPRHLDRNIAVVGRVVEGIEHLSSLPRGTGPLGFYETAAERVPIVSITPAESLPLPDRPRFEVLETGSEAFAKYADARANRRDPFFIRPAGGADVCNVPVPVRRVRAPG